MYLHTSMASIFPFFDIQTACSPIRYCRALQLFLGRSAGAEESHVLAKGFLFYYFLLMQLV